MLKNFFINSINSLSLYLHGWINVERRSLQFFFSSKLYHKSTDYFKQNIKHHTAELGKYIPRKICLSLEFIKSPSYRLYISVRFFYTSRYHKTLKNIAPCLYYNIAAAVLHMQKIVADISASYKFIIKCQSRASNRNKKKFFSMLLKFIPLMEDVSLYFSFLFSFFIESSTFSTFRIFIFNVMLILTLANVFRQSNMVTDRHSIE